MEKRIPVHLIRLTFAGCRFEKWVENGPDQIQHLAYTHVGYSAAAVANYLSVFCMPWPLGLFLLKDIHGILIMQTDLLKTNKHFLHNDLNCVRAYNR